jgi:glutathione S-transferase
VFWSRKKRQKNRAKKLRQKAKKTAASEPLAPVAAQDGLIANVDGNETAQQLVLGYWNTRALAHDLRAMLVWGGVDFEDRRYEVGPAPLYDKSEWMDAKEGLGLAFPNLPFLVDRANGVAITQHQSILRYLAQRLGLEGKGATGAAMADMASEASREWLDAFCSLTYASYLSYSQTKGPYLAETLPHHANRFETILLDQERAVQGGETVAVFLCGASECSLTYADFFLFEVLEQHRLWNPLCFEKFPARMNCQTTLPDCVARFCYAFVGDCRLTF